MTATISRPKTQKVRNYSPDGDIGRRLQEAFLLQSEIQRLQQQLDTHRAYFLKHMEQQRLDKIELFGITVQRKVRHNWQYTPETHREMLKLQTTQRWEQSKGLATDSPKAYIALTHKVVQK